MIAVCRLGLSSGSVTLTKRFHGPAPNTSAASPYSLGISPMPATRITIMIAVARQISASTTATKIDRLVLVAEKHHRTVDERRDR